MDTDGIEQCRVRNDNNPRAIKFGIQIENVENQHWTIFLGMKHNRKFLMHSILIPEEKREDDTETNEETSDGIRSKKSHAVKDASMSYDQMRGHCKIVHVENQVIASKETFNKKWGANSPKAVEEVTILDVLELVKGSTEENLEGELIAINDNELVHNNVNKKWEQAG